MATVIGLDLSLTATGVCVIENKKIKIAEIIKSKPTGKKPIDEVKRLKKIVDTIQEYIKTNKPDIVLLEGIAYMAHKTVSISQLSALNYMVRSLCVENNIPFYVVAPSTLKKFITGKGNAPKDHMILETYKRYDLSILDNNIVDAHGLARIGEVICNDSEPSNEAQRAVIKLLNKNQP